MSKVKRLLQAYITLESLTPDIINTKQEVSILLSNGSKKKYTKVQKSSLFEPLWTLDAKDPIQNFEDMKYKIYLGVYRVNELIELIRNSYKVNQPIINENFEWTYTASIMVNSKGEYIQDSFFIQPSAYFAKCLEENRHSLNDFSKEFRQIENELKEKAFNLFLNGVAMESISNFKVELFKYTSPFLNKNNIYYVKRIPPNSQEDLVFNSFYIEDLEKVLKSINEGHKGPVFNYLSGIDKSERKDIDQDFNLQHDILKLENLPLGRWPSNNQYRLSTMQQIAINTILSKESKGTIRSVNGPPGTGKTTLLKDIFAQIIVERALELSKLRRPEDGFHFYKQIELTNGYKYNFHRLNEKLKGFSIIVASSNNGAVENISRELLKRGEVIRNNEQEDKDYTDEALSLDYYREIASLVINNTEDFEKSNKDDSWGLFSAPLGKGTNLNTFFNQLLNKKSGFDISSKLEEEKPLDWKETVDEFKHSVEKVKRRKLEIKKIIELYLESADFNTEKLAELSKIIKIIEREISEKSQKLDTFKKQSTDIENIINSYSPIYRYQGLFSKKSREKRKELDNLKNKYQSIKKQMFQQQKEIDNKIQMKKKILKQIDQLYKNKELYLKEIEQKQVTNLILPKNDHWDDHNYEMRQIKTIYLEDKLNHYRALCFLKAMKVHKAFQQHNKNIISKNLNLLRYRQYINLNTDVDAIPDLWETLHLIVPVISTTFSSLSSMLRGVNAGEIGYLIIDEAGQAVPQAAVGGIWRAKQTIVVGDPIQIEPVVTIDDTIIKDIQQYFELDNNYFSANTSVQKLADLCNPYGTYRNESDEWIGIPLWVHRRCLNPMFKIANEIAYDNKMVLPEAMKKKYIPEDSLGGSKWVNIKGKVTGKQFVKEQSDYIFNYVKNFFKEEHDLKRTGKLAEERSIYIISPFTEIIKELKKIFRARKHELMLDTYSLNANQWISQCIGTVHTFQGKEAHTVLFVCGTDKDTTGARKWISQKPNLLNVAVTRAKKRFILIADEDLFKNDNYFNVFHKSLTIDSFNIKS
jgi:superfamily I DNA and/or RNA helicase